MLSRNLGLYQQETSKVGIHQKMTIQTLEDVPRGVGGQNLENHGIREMQFKSFKN